VSDEAELRSRLGSSLAGLRRERSLSGEKLGLLVEMSQGKISKLERGVLRASPDDVERIVRALDGEQPVSSEVARDLVGLARRLHPKSSPRRVPLPVESPAAFQPDYLDAEAKATRIRNFEPIAIPGLLQISEYTRRLLNAFFDVAAGDSKGHWMDTAATVTMRARRQQRLYDTNKTFEFVIMESVLGNRFASPSVMLAQLDRLELASENDNISIRIVPAFAELGYVPVQGFNLYDEDFVITESFSAAISHDRRSVDFYAQFFQQYSDIADPDLGPILAKYRGVYADLARSRLPAAGGATPATVPEQPTAER
jgi:hypothetical protein